LEGVTVLDLGLAIAGPYGTQILSDLGAQVIKINALYDTYWHSNHIAYMANRGKRSIALDLKDPRAMKVLRQLVEKADVVQHNMRYDAAERLKIDYESLKAINPKLIYCHTRGFESGPREGLPGNDQTGACLAVCSTRTVAAGGAVKPAVVVDRLGDTGNGFLRHPRSSGALSARAHRSRSVLRHLDRECPPAQQLLCHRAPGRQRLRAPADRRAAAGLWRHPTGSDETRDGWLCIVLAAPEDWDRFCIATGLDGLAADARFATAALRSRNNAALAPLLESSCASVLRLSGSPCWMRHRYRARCRIRSSPWACTMIRSSRRAAGGRLRASIRRPAQSGRAPVRSFGDAGTRTGSPADRGAAQP
jgi:crotonobetainyl-CoA:carnitine CoA-transferase CaiB-like acyl-CoA transferase